MILAGVRAKISGFRFKSVAGLLQLQRDFDFEPQGGLV